MDVHGSFNLQDNQLMRCVIEAETGFPADPKSGRFSFINKVLYFCIDAVGLPVWVPLTKSLSMEKYVQNTPALEWTINHDLNISLPLVQVYDASGKWIVPDEIDCSVFNRVLIKFNTPIAGSAVIMRGELDGAAPPIIAYENDYTDLSVWVVSHNLGYNPAINCYVDNELVQPQSIVHNSTTQATVTFSANTTGSVRCV